jgi:preprotein translocase subunit SecD
MREFDGNSLSKRLQDAKRGKLARLQNATQASKIHDPAAVERKAAERVIVQARRIETAERKEAKAEATRKLAAQEAAEKAQQAELAERNARIEALAQADKIELAKIAARAADGQKAALAAEQKAARDARYAARKNRQR